MEQRRLVQKLTTGDIDPTRLYEWEKIRDTVNKYKRRQRRVQTLSTDTANTQSAALLAAVPLQQQSQVMPSLRRHQSALRKHEGHGGGHVPLPPLEGGRPRQRACNCFNHAQHMREELMRLRSDVEGGSLTRDRYREYCKYFTGEEIEEVLRTLPQAKIEALYRELGDELPEELVRGRLAHKLVEQQVPKSERLLFYQNLFRPKVLNKTIDTLLSEWQNDYHRLEGDRTYIQYLCPQFIGNDAKQDIETFRRSIEIGERIARAYGLLLGALGLELVDMHSGKVQHRSDYAQRYRETLLVGSASIVYKIKKMLQFLNITGFRKYAVQFVRFMHYEIFGINGKHILKDTAGKKMLVRAPPLQAIAPIFEEWRLFGELPTNAGAEEVQRAANLLSEQCAGLPYSELCKNSELFQDSPESKLLFPGRVDKQHTVHFEQAAIGQQAAITVAEDEKSTHESSTSPKSVITKAPSTLKSSTIKSQNAVSKTKKQALSISIKK